MNNLYQKIVEKWQSYEIKSAAALDQYLDNFRVLFAYNSGKIENDAVEYHSTRDIFENGKVSGFTGEVRAIFEQQNQKMCYEFLREKIIKKEPLSVPLLLEIHGILTAGCYDQKRFIERGERPGMFKKHDYVTGINQVGYPPDSVEDAISELIEEMATHGGDNALKAAAYFHLKFEYIHPFADGNGRVGRTAMNYFLMINNHPPLIIFEEDRGIYFAALEKYDSSEDITCMFDFLKLQTEKTWTKPMRLGEFR